MGYSDKLLGVMVATVLWMPAAEILYPANTLAQEASSPDTEAAARLAEADRLFQQGRQQFQSNQFREALQLWQQALEIFQEPNLQTILPQESLLGEGRVLSALGAAYLSLRQYQQASDILAQSLVVVRKIGDRDNEGYILNNLGAVYQNLGQYQEAISYYEQSLVILQETSDRQAIGGILANIGESYFELKQYQQAINFYDQSLIVFRDYQDLAGEEATLGSLAETYLNLEQYQQAIDLCKQQLTVARQLGNLQGQANALGNWGVAYARMDRYQEAITFFHQVLRIMREVDDRQGEIDTLDNLGDAYGNLGQYQEAITFYLQRLDIIRELGDRLGEAEALDDLGMASNALGQYRQAIDLLEQSLVISRELGNRTVQETSLGNLATIYLGLGQYERAIYILEQNLIFSRENGDRRAEGAILGNLGIAYRNLRQYERAIDFYEQALAIFRETGDRSDQGKTLGNLGIIYINLGQYERAIDFLEQDLTISREIENRSGEVGSLGNLGVAYSGLRQYGLAVNFHEQQLLAAREISDRREEGNALSNLGAVYYDLRQFSASIDTLLEAIAIYDALRTADLHDAEKITFFDTYLRIYLALQRSLVAQNEAEQALVYGERGRARAFVELLANRISTNGNADVASLESINSLDLSEIQRVAREQNATLVNYSVIFDESLFIWVIQPTGEIAFQQVDLGDHNLSELVSLVRETLGARSQDRATVIAELTPAEAERRQAQRQQQLQQLHQILIEPIASSLPTDPNQRVIFIPHQDLFLVPFAALVDGNGDYLIEQHTILTAPSIQVLNLTYQQAIANQARRDRPTGSLIVGNPIMPSVWNPQTNQTVQLSNLPGAEREAIAIAKALDTDALLSGSASKATVMAQMPNARIIHLATHGLLEYGSPEDSGVLDVPGAIALAPSANESGLLTAAEILQMDLNAELVVLSACDTGRGRITGDGVIGLSRAFVTAGVPSLMVSLWAVDDDATAEWMVTFYDQWQQTGDKAQALRQAMLTTMENHPDPRLWAAFTLIGSAE